MSNPEIVLEEVYLDNNATTPCDPRVVEKMLPFFNTIYGNPSNGYHKQGRQAARAVDEAREHVAALIGARPSEIFFTSGATESNNLAVFGVVDALQENNRKRIITSQIEHKAILQPYLNLSQRGFDAIVLPVTASGVLDPEKAKSEITNNSLLVSIHLANNEIGTIQPIKQVAEYAHAAGAIVHCDAAQAVGKISVDVNDLGIDLLSISAHKLYGPKGVGCLYVRGGQRLIQLHPLLYGGGQEKGLRSGTTNVPGIVGFGEAARLSSLFLNDEGLRIEKLRDLFEKSLLANIKNLKINGLGTSRLPNTSSLTFPGIAADALLLNLPNLMLSTGSACNSGALEPSHVLEAIGLSRENAHSTIRASLGRFTTTEQMKFATEQVIKVCQKLLEM